MSLEFNTVPVKFTKGLDRSDLFLSSPGEQTGLVDCVFDDAQSIIRRPGYSPVSTIGLSGTPLRMSRNGANPIIESFYGLFLVNPTNGGATEVKAPGDPASTFGGHLTYGQMLRADVRTSTIGAIGNPVDPVGLQPVSFDCAGTPNTANVMISAFVWAETNGSAAGAHRIHLRVVDDTTEALIVDKFYEPTGVEDFWNPRLVAGGRRIWVVWNDTSTSQVRGDCLNLDTLAFVGTTVLGVPATGSGRFDAVFDATNTSCVIAYRDNGTTQMQFKWFNNALVQTQAVQVAITAPTTNISLCDVGAGKIIANYGIGTGLVKAVSCTFAGVTQAEATVSSPPDGLVASGIGRVCSGVVSGKYVVLYDYSAAGTYALPTAASQTKIVFVRASTATMAALDQANFVSQVMLYGNPISGAGAIGSSTSFFLPVIYPSLLEPSVYVLNVVFPNSGTPVAENPRVVARIAWGEAGGFCEQATISRFRRVVGNYVSSTGHPVFAFAKYGGQTAAAGTTLVSTVVACRAELDYQTQALGYAEQNNNTLLAGSCPLNFDGANVFEGGFCQAPLITPSRVIGAGNLSAGTYYFAATYAFKDANGNWHESEPSKIASVSGILGGDSYSVVVNAPPLCAHPNVQVIIYRSTASNASVLYRDNGLPNVTNAGLADTAIVSGSQLPTTGGVLPNQPLPSCRVIADHQNRLFFLGGGDGYDVFFSHERSDGYAPEFHSLLKRRVPVSWGRVVSGVSMDDKFVIFCENRIGYIYGTGPTRTGANDNYSQPIECVSGYGAQWTAPLAVVRTDDGAWFQGPLGLRLLTRNLAIEKDQEANDYGSSIDNALQGNIVVKAVIAMSKQQVRFYTAVNTVFVYDNLWNQWSTFSNHACIDALTANGNFYHVDNTGTLYRTDPRNPDADDNGTLIKMSVETAWLAVAGLQGFQRVSRALLLAQASAVGGSPPNAQLLTISVASDYENNYTTVVNGVLVSPQNPSVDSSVASRYQVEMQLPRQKCESIRFKIEATNDGAGDSTRLRLTALTLLVGLKKGRFKTAQSARV